MPATFTSAPIDTWLAQASNLLLIVTIAAYAFAMLAYAGDLAFGRRRRAAAKVVPAAAPVLVGAAVGAGVSGPSAGTAAVLGGGAGTGTSAASSRWPVGGWLRSAFMLTVSGALVQILSVVTRGMSEHRLPWGNMYEFVAAFTCMAVLVLIAASIWLRAYYMGLFVLIPVVLALGLDATVIYTPAGQLGPALQSYWLAIHIPSIILAVGLLTFGAVVTVMYLIAERSERRLAAGIESGAAGIMSHLPGASILDRLSYRSVLFGFPALTFAIIAGAMWADQAWGRYWGWDPKETWSFITWVIYAAYLHARATAGWRGKRAAYIHLAAYAALLFNMIGINLWVTGLHSYAGIN